MPRELTPAQLIERSIQKKYRKELWTPFILAVRRYALIQAGDRVAACVCGDRASMLLAKLLQLLQRYSETPFEVRCLSVDPGWSPGDRAKLEENAALLGIPLTVVEGGAANGAAPGGRARRSQLYGGARALGCNKIALGHSLNDVIESTVTAMLHGGELRGLMPKQHSALFEGMELIRPLYCVHEEDIAAWMSYNRLELSRAVPGGDAPGRREVKALLKTLRRDNPDIEKSVFNAIHSVSLDTFPGWRSGGEARSFLEGYDQRPS